MLSCRSKSSIQAAAPLDIREALAARNIVAIVGTEFHDQITHMPFAPYALSLSLRVFYREIRFGATSPFTRKRVCKQLLNACELLRTSFSSNFPRIMKVAELAEKTVDQMNKAYSNLIQQYGGSGSTSETINHENQPITQNISSLPEVPDMRSFAEGAQMMDIDHSMFGGMPDLDVFEFFDPGFHLDAVDAAMVDSMALTSSPTVFNELTSTETTAYQSNQAAL